MLIAIIGTHCSGRRSIMRYLRDKGFSPISVVSDAAAAGSEAASPSGSNPDEDRDVTSEFNSASDMLAHTTRNWHQNFVTMSLTNIELVESFIKRPFFMLISVDAPLLTRFRRSNDTTLEEFVSENDAQCYGTVDPSHAKTQSAAAADSSLHSLRTFAAIHIVNDFAAINTLYAHLDKLDLLDQNRLRPDWDTYFMMLASHASMRSNCMKRRVGAVLVRENRIVATGYNGTPRGLMNCNDGGCARCNGSQHAEDACLCLHAEENALLEAGRERSSGATLFCNTCPCLTCSIKIIQTGVREVVYNLSYKVDDASAALFREADVLLRRHHLPHQL